MDTLVNIFPSNAFQPLADATMLQVIVIALFFGFGIIAVGGKGGCPPRMWWTASRRSALRLCP